MRLEPLPLLAAHYGEFLYAEGEYTAAIEVLRDAYRSASDAGYPYLMLSCRAWMGNCYSDLGRMEEMLTHYSVAERLAEAGAAAIMPLAAPIGSNRGLRTREMLQILIDEIRLPIVVDAGIGRPSEAAEAMEMGASAVLVNTPVATAGNPLQMAEAFRLAVQAGRAACLAGPGRVLDGQASASSPLTGFLREEAV